MPPEIQNNTEIDTVAAMLERYAQNILVVVFGLLPLFFVPVAAAPFEYSKILFATFGVISTLVLLSLSILRSGKITIRFSYVLLSLWVVALVAFIAASFSGDLHDAFVGDQLNIHTAVFVVILALTASMWSLLNIQKATVMRLYMLLAASTVVLVIFHLIRLFFGPSILSFGIFTSAITTPIGGWNDLALFLGLSIIISLIALEQLPLTKLGKILFGIVTLFALAMLAVINFFVVWLVLGLVSLVALVYTLGKDRFSTTQMSFIQQKSSKATSLPLTLIVFAISVLFIIGGGTLGGFITKHTNISYIEVRPSLESTVNIARQVFQKDPFLGTGPNKFVDAWRTYKDPTINSTVFWNTDFNAGNGYITTFFITTGILGGIAWLIFLILFAISGLRYIMTASDADRMWYFVGTSSFVSALYIWGMSTVYVPGAVVLLLGALCTGVMIAAQNVQSTKRALTFSIINNRRAGFLLTLVVIAIIVGSVSTLYVSGRHFSASYIFNQSQLALQNGASLDEVSAEIQSAYQLSNNDMYTRRIAELELTRMTQLLAVQSPTADQQKEFQTSLVNGVNAANQATQLDSTEPANWSVLGAIYNLLIKANDDALYKRASEALTKAKDLDPKNPIARLSYAIFEARAGHLDIARQYAEEATTLKPDYTDAVYFISQLDIASGDLAAALRSTQAMITLEPNNPARYYQLGVLESAQKQTEAAAAAFEYAIQLDQNYANARYLLAFSYDTLKRPQDAKAQLEKVLELNPGNENVIALLDTLNRGESLTKAATSSTTPTTTVKEQSNVNEENGTVVSKDSPDSSLVTPVNTAPKAEKTTDDTAQ